MVNGMKTFSKGGVHPAGHKELSNAIAIRNAEVKGTLIFPMSMHIGAPAECLVKVGDEVNEGMLIGKAAGFISANIYCSVKGVVKEIKDIYLASGMKTKAVVVETAEDFKPGEVKFEASDWEKLTPKEIVDKIAAAGIVGLGGATFPVNVKYSIPPDSKVDALVINGVECEPYLTADHRLMLEKTEQLFKGMRIIAKAINAPKIFVGIEANKPDAIQKMTEFAAKNGGDIEIVPLQLKYPQGDEKQLLKAVIDKEIPSGKLPIAIGAVVSNVGTVNAVYEAVALGKPLYERVVTVTGGGIKNPGNYLVKVGTKVGDLVEQCGGFTDDAVKLIMGGPMMGFTFSDLDTPVIKGTSGILVLSAKEAKKGQRTACLQCGRCLKACPIGLQPTKLFKKINSGKYAEALKLNLMDCKECGCCAFVCPANIPLVQGFRLGKRMAPKPPKKG
ncbi:MAG: electron transport complex subunit RsxC [Spirochaetia bacterium]|nr:electron transport complex subunit RsxC [Spirochaetia bacterium]MBR3671638.1 electron transport complex subunit RsxC [Spirochaetia bacterium]